MTDQPILIDMKPIDDVGDESYANVLPLLFEVRHALEEFQHSANNTTVDLRRIPMTPNDEEYLEEILGIGEVSIEINTLGKTRIRETKFPGVWHIVHYNADDEITGKYVSVAAIPDLVMTQPEDAARGLRALIQETDALAREQELRL
tara:strand:- start:9 stop:449 length:441 start_codon:yes stop_codon:yes gene_type:complete